MLSLVKQPSLFQFNQSKTIGNVPTEVLCKILTYCDYDDLMRVKNVCKILRGCVNYVIDRSAICVKDKLSASRKEEFNSKFHNLFYDNDNQINQYLICNDSKYFLNIKEYHPYIKKLIIHNPFLISYLPFINLEYLIIEIRFLPETCTFKEFRLELNRRNYYDHFESNEFLSDLFLSRDFNCLKHKDDNSIYLKLPKLINLKFYSNNYFKRLNVFINSPELKSLSTNLNLDNLRIRFPLSIEYLTLEENGYSLVQFKNLKKLNLYYLNTNLNIFKQFTKLKEIYFYKTLNQYLNLESSIDYYYKNVKLIPTNQIDSTTNLCKIPINLNNISNTTLDDNNLNILFKNNHNLILSDELKYRELRLDNLNYLTNEVICKLKNLKSINITFNEQDKHKYIELFKNNSLDSLILKSSFTDPINQQFLNLIPIYNPLLTFLKVDNFEDIQFVTSLKHLSYLKTEQFFEIDLIKKFFDRLYNLKKIEIIIFVDIYKFKLIDNQINCSLNYETFLVETKKKFIQIDDRQCIWKLIELFVKNYK